MTEAWSNDAENSALHHKNKLQLKMYTHQVFNIFILSNTYCKKKVAL